MVQNHRVSMIPRTKFSVCEGGTIGKRKEPLLRSEIFTELEVSQFFLIFWITAQELWGLKRPGSEKWAQLGDRLAQQPSEGCQVLSGEIP